MREPSFVHLLLPAFLIKLDEQIELGGVEISRRITKGKTAILANPNKCNIDRRDGEFLADTFDGSLRIGFRIKKVIAGDSGFVNQPRNLADD